MTREQKGMRCLPKRNACFFSRLAGVPDWEVYLTLAHEHVKFAKAGMQGVEDDQERGPLCLLPALHCLHHAVELFLKAGLIRIGKKPKRLNHNLKALWELYNRRIQPKDLRFNWDIVKRLYEWDEVAKRKVPKLAAGTALRYLHDRNGQPLFLGVWLPVERIRSLAIECDREFARIHVRIIQLTSERPPAFLVHPLNTWWEPREMFEERSEKAKEAILRDLQQPSSR